MSHHLRTMSPSLRPIWFTSEHRCPRHRPDLFLSLLLLDLQIFQLSINSIRRLSRARSRLLQSLTPPSSSLHLRLSFRTKPAGHWANPPRASALPHLRPSVGTNCCTCVGVRTHAHCPCTACSATQAWNATTSTLPMGRMVTSLTVLISTGSRLIPKRASTWLLRQAQSVAPFRISTISRDRFL